MTISREVEYRILGRRNAPERSYRSRTTLPAICDYYKLDKVVVILVRDTSAFDINLASYKKLEEHVKTIFREFAEHV